MNRHKTIVRRIAHLAMQALLGAPLLLSQDPVAVDLASIIGRTEHALAYDGARERVVLFGGRRYMTNWTPMDETWTWNGHRWTLQDAGARPTARYGHAMAFDEARRVVVLFGGSSGSDETWEWDGHAWQLRNPSTRPPGRSGHCMAYDSVRQRTVLFGPTADSWEWDGCDWHQINSATHPPSLPDCAMTYDHNRQRTVLLARAAFQATPETWEWDGSDWSQRTSMQPQALAHISLAYDQARARTVAQGTDLSMVPSTWEWDGVQWAANQPASQPFAVAGKLAYDAARDETIFFGGEDPQGWGIVHDPVETQAWNGVDWHYRDIGNQHPWEDSPRGIAAVTSRGVIVLAGKGTLEWDGSHWIHHLPTGYGPYSDGHAVAFDSLRDVVVLFGGWYSGGIGATGGWSGPVDLTYEWNGIGWAHIQPPTSPPARHRHAQAFDDQRGETVLFGGVNINELGDTWGFDGSTWTQHQPSTSPPSRGGHGMAYDPVRAVTVLHGGRAGNADLGDTWLWDGTNWQQVATATAPPAASDHAMCWDPSHQQVVIYVQDELWGFDGSTWTKRNAQPLPTANGGAMSYDVHRQALVIVDNLGTTRLLGNVVEPEVQRIGTGCPGANGIPQVFSDPPRLGDTSFNIELSAARGNSPTLFALSLTNQSAGLGSGCTAQLGGQIVTLLAVSSQLGHAQTAIPIPLSLSLRGLEIFGQAAILDPQGALSGIAVSGGLRLRIGD